MKLGLGIDTGGTYTDSVVYDFDTDKVIAKAKALTTKDDLIIGITNSLSKLPDEYCSKVCLVSLSTTLATNACVENKGGRGKLILLGYDMDILKKLGSNYGLPDCRDIIMISGRHGQQGQETQKPDWEALKNAVTNTISHVDAFGVAEYWGIRNPAFEQEAKKLIREWTGCPVVIASELSAEPNSLRRASSTLLNARLIPLIDSLIKAVKLSLSQKGVQAPLMIVRGDGTLMSEEYARERPVETLLSGPASSVIGGMKQSGFDDCLILDIGGTTSDLAVVRNGFVSLADEGVDIGDWRTGTRAIQIRTIGLGGDSLISFDNHDQMTIGPRKATPLAWMAHMYPEIKDTLNIIHADSRWHSFSLAEFFFLTGQEDDYDYYTKEEIKIIEALKKGPRSIEQLADAVNTRPYFLRTQNLESLGIIGRSGLTPTDIMHITGEYRQWDENAALLGAQIIANRFTISVDELASRVKEYIERRLYNMIVKHLLNRNINKPGLSFSQDALDLFNMGFDNPYSEINMSINTPLPLVGIGAPTHIFLNRVAKALGTQSVVANDAEVANAVGSITGSMVGEETVVVRPRYDPSGITGYGCHGSANYFETDNYDEAIEWAKKEAGTNALAKTKAMGACDIEVNIDVVKKSAKTKGDENGLLLEILVIGRGIGKVQRLV